jgi:hypothetical protein
MHTHLSDLVQLAAAVLPGSSSAPVVFLYFGPETVLPLASFIAAAAGVILMFWRNILAMIRKVLRRGSAPVEVRDDLDMDLGITTTRDTTATSKGEGE